MNVPIASDRGLPRTVTGRMRAVAPLCLLPLGLLLLAAGLTACEKAERGASALTPVTLRFRWAHQAQFAGLYAADQNGYYAAEGLAVTLREGGPGVDSIASVLSNETQFGVERGYALIQARAEGKTVRAIATIYRRSPLVIFALASSGITRPKDLAGKTIRYPPGVTSAPLDMMMANLGIAPHQYTLKRVSDMTPLYSGEVHASSGFLTNEVLRAQRAGHKLNIIYLDDYGVHFYSDTIFSRDELIANNPDLVRRFLRATLKGWTYAVENPTAVGPMVRKYRPAADPEFETAQMIASIPLVNTGEDQIGWMKPEKWAGMERTLRSQRVLAKPLDVTQVYMLEFLREIYGRQ